MIMSLDDDVEDEHGHFGWGAPEDEEVHAYINQLASSVVTYLNGRRMYETMVNWDMTVLDCLLDSDPPPAGRCCAISSISHHGVRRVLGPATL
jgi:hypothetical protein